MRATVLSVYSMFFNLSLGILTYIIGKISDNIPMNIMLISFGIYLVIVSIIVYIVNKNDKWFFLKNRRNI